MHEIKHIGVFQAAKFAAAMYLLISAVIVIPLTFILMVFGGERANPFGLLALLLPLLYAIVGFVFTAIGCWVYNLVAMMVGGIEIELEPKQ
ncbi:MAG: hypothetical protein ABSE56_19245 [Bryobacteraceae bacterium]|jgi:hypothetical protein